MSGVGGLLLAVSASGAAQAPQIPICSDRPAKANAVCTIPAGRIQIEASAVGWSRDDSGAEPTELMTIGAFVAKLGLSESSDLQVGFAPYAELRVGNGSGKVSGIGDVVVRYKRRLSGPGGSVQIAAIPFVKLPTASNGLGNGKAEGGIAVPISLVPSGPVTLTFGPELGLVADSDGRGRHLALAKLVNLSAPVAPRMTIFGEIWTRLDFDPAGTVRQSSFDAAMAYAVSNDLQLDVGINVGLTRDTPDLESYVGLSLRF